MEERSTYKDSFFKKVLTLGSGTAMAHVLLFISTPVLTRLYQPESMGAYALFMSIASVFIAISSGKLEMAVVVADEEKEGIEVLHASWITHILWSLLFYFLWILVLFFNPFQVLDFIDYRLLALVPVFGGMQLLFESLKQWALRKEAFKMMSASNLIKAIATIVIQIGFALAFVANVWALVAGLILSLLLGNRWMWNLYKKDRKKNSVSLSKNTYKAVFKKYKKFPSFTSPSILLNAFVLQIPVWVLSGISMALTGLYNIAERVLQAPLLLVGHSVGQVFYKNAQMIKTNQEALKNLTWKVYKSLFYLMIVPYFLLYYWGEPIFSWILGEKWLQAGLIAGYLAPQLLFNFTVSPISNLWYVLNRNQQGIYFQGILLIGRLVLVLAFYLFSWEWMELLKYLGLFGAIVYGLLAWSFLKRLGLKTTSFILQIVLPLLLLHGIIELGLYSFI